MKPARGAAAGSETSSLGGPLQRSGQTGGRKAEMDEKCMEVGVDGGVDR